MLFILESRWIRSLPFLFFYYHFLKALFLPLYVWKMVFPILCYIFSVIYVLCFYLIILLQLYTINFRLWTGNVAATKKMKWLFWWAGPSQVCTYCPHRCKCFSTNVKRHCIDLHHNYILQAFVLKMVICTSYFFINNFPSFLKAKIAYEIGLSPRLCSLGFGLNT